MKFVLVACVAVLSHDLASAQAPKAAPVLSLERPGDGAPKCGLGKAFHSGRRKALRDVLKEGIVVVRGLSEPRDYLAFRQDKVFWYLTGVESPDAALLMDCKSGREVLFLPPHEGYRENWNGEVWDASDEWVKELTGFAEVQPNSAFESAIQEFARGGGAVWVSMHPNVALAGCFDQAGPIDKMIRADPLDGRASREQALRDALIAKLSSNEEVSKTLTETEAALAQKFGVKPKDLAPALKQLKVTLLGKSAIEVKDFAPAMNEMRRIKVAEEIDAMRRAGRSGALAMSEAMRSTAPGLGEWDLESVMSWIHMREGAAGPAYHAIVGSGTNSLVLHYGASNRRMKDGEVVLIDYAPELDHYTCDITRTWPVNGRFSERQAELYDAVLEAQLAGIAAVKPGSSIRDVSQVCSKVFEARGLAQLQRHGPCHYIGMEVHDVGEYDKKFEPGVCFTVEPGLYEEATGIGIRIEDVVCVTKDGCEVLSAGVPKDRASIEKLVQSEGVLDWLAQREQ